MTSGRFRFKLPSYPALVQELSDQFRYADQRILLQYLIVVVMFPEDTNNMGENGMFCAYIIAN